MNGYVKAALIGTAVGVFIELATSAGGARVFNPLDVAFYTGAGLFIQVIRGLVRRPS